MQQNLDERPYLESFDGLERIKMPPLMHRGLAAREISRIFGTLAGDSGFVVIEPHMRIGAVDGSDTVFVPDVAYVSNERLRASYPGGNVVPPFAPDIAVEVRSPDTTAAERERKFAKYVACGALLVLDVDSEGRTITAYAKGSAPRRFGVGDRFEHPAIDWLRFDVADAFADVDRFEKIAGLRERQ